MACQKRRLQRNLQLKKVFLRKALLKKAYDVLAAVFAKKFLQVSAKQEPVGPPQ